MCDNKKNFRFCKLKEQCPSADICWLLSLLVKNDDASFKVNMANHSQDITKKQFQGELKVPSQKQSLFHNIYKKKKKFTFVLGEQ